jgi:hypothetical protein
MIEDGYLERVCRQMCAELGEDPEESVPGDPGAGLTSREIPENCPGIMPAMMVYWPRWRTYRDAASKLIAFHRAFDKIPAF